MSIVLGILSFIVFAFFQARHIPSGDSGDLLTAALTFGVPHPPGYPLYTFTGWLISHIPLSTPVWRIGLLSSVPHALTIVLLYKSVYVLTKRPSAALLACIILSGNYLFFLYSVTPEVFALLDLFVVTLLWCIVQFEQYRNISSFLAISCIFGLSLTHHQVILFIVPGLVYFFFRYKKQILPAFPAGAALMVLGFIPYIYVAVAGAGGSIINWDRVVDFSHFIQLVTRSDYGTFQSGAVFGSLPVQRLLQLKAFAQFVWMDFTWIGVFGAVAGFLALRKKHTWFATTLLLIFLCMGPVFLVYASFPLTNRFTLATFERFLLPAYICLSVAIAAGISSVSDAVSSWNRIPRRMERTVSSGIMLVAIAVFTVISVTTAQKFHGYNSDRTAEFLARDILDPLPAGSILLLNRDTPLFTTQFVRYGLGVRGDIAVIHANKLGTPEFTGTLKRALPGLHIPASKGSTFIAEFLRQNSKQKRIFSNARIGIDPGWHWVPFGLVYELRHADNLPTVPEMISSNVRLWGGLHDPGSGILSRYDHMMLSDVRDVYTSSRLEFGKTVMRAGEFGTAKDQFTAAIGYGGDTELSDAFVQRGLAESFLKECDAAFNDFRQSEHIAVIPDKNITAYRAMTYYECVGDRAKATELFDRYKHETEKEQVPLKEL